MNHYGVIFSGTRVALGWVDRGCSEVGASLASGLAFGVDAVPGGNLDRPVAGCAAEDHFAQ